MRYPLHLDACFLLPVIVALLREAAQWLGQHGPDQWQYPPNETRIVRGIKAGHVFLTKSKDGPVATITLDKLQMATSGLKPTTQRTLSTFTDSP